MPLKTIGQYNDILKKNKNVDFFTASLRNRSDNPAKYDQAQDNAIAEAKRKVTALLNSARDYSPANKNHEADLKAYQSYGCNPGAVENAYIKAALETAKVPPVQYRNLSYESSFLSSYPLKSNDAGTQTGYYTALTLDDQLTLEKFRDTFISKWSAVGYADDIECRAQFWKNNSITTLQNNQPMASSVIPVSPAKADF